MDIDGAYDSGIDNSRTQAATLKMARLSSSRLAGERVVAEECPVALVYDGTTSAVLMATPADLADLAFGFSLTEGIVHDISDIRELSVIPGAGGVELRMWLGQDRAALLKARRRRLVGPTGCGLCGIESLEAANRSPLPSCARYLSRRRKSPKPSRR